MTRNRKIGSIKTELLIKAREAMLTAVQIFNNPNVLFKSESFIVLSNIAWTYLLHAYYRNENVDYRYFEQHGSRKRFSKTKNGAHKYWELERCLNDDNCPIDNVAKANLKFLIGLRHEIEHQMTTRIDDFLSARFQACCLNFNKYIKELFEEKLGIDKHLSFSLQFSSINEDHINQLKEFKELPKNIATYINAFDETIPADQYNDMRYSYRVLYIPKSVNHKGHADKVIEFVPANSPEAEQLNKEYVLIKEREKPKFLPSQIVQAMKDKGYTKFGIYQHTLLWKSKNIDFRNTTYGTKIAKVWYWYESWVKEVEMHCKESGELYR